MAREGRGKTQQRRIQQASQCVSLSSTRSNEPTVERHCDSEGSLNMSPCSLLDFDNFDIQKSIILAMS